MNPKQIALLELCELCDTNGAVNGQVNDVVWIENRKALTAWATDYTQQQVSAALKWRRDNPNWRERPAQKEVKPAPIETPKEPVKTQPRGTGGFYDSLGESQMYKYKMIIELGTGRDDALIFKTPTPLSVGSLVEFEEDSTYQVTSIVHMHDKTPIVRVK